jgi:hypothetical protein
VDLCWGFYVGEDEFYSHRDVVMDLYFGRGRDNPSITTRLNNLEMFKDNMIEKEKSRQAWIKSLVLLTITQTCLLIGALIALMKR